MSDSCRLSRLTPAVLAISRQSNAASAHAPLNRSMLSADTGGLLASTTGCAWGVGAAFGVGLVVV